MKSINRSAAVVAAISLSACTAIDVKPISNENKVSHVCIQENPKVIIRDFLPAIEDILESHLITSDVYSGRIPADCEYKMTYVAFQRWDFVTYMTDAEIKVYKEEKQVGYAQYHLRGGGGLSLMKWAGVKSKMTPVMEELLSEIK